MSQFLSRDSVVIYGVEKNFKISHMTKLLMSPINSTFQRGDQWGSV